MKKRIELNVLVGTLWYAGKIGSFMYFFSFLMIGAQWFQVNKWSGWCWCWCCHVYIMRWYSQFIIILDWLRVPCVFSSWIKKRIKILHVNGACSFVFLFSLCFFFFLLFLHFERFVHLNFVFFYCFHSDATQRLVFKCIDIVKCPYIVSWRRKTIQKRNMFFFLDFKCVHTLYKAFHSHSVDKTTDESVIN